MAREKFIDRSFSRSSVKVIETANEIIAEYQAQGFTLTLRQLYYQFVARGLLANKQKEYKRLGSVINDARLAGRIDWNAIEDRTRNLKDYAFWDNPAEIIQGAAQSYREDKWDSQPYRMEVWIEKDALVGVIEPVCREFNVPHFACRGYSSQSEQYRAGKRLAQYIDRGQQVIILHLGDHDPSGIDMTRDNRDRLGMFAREEVHVKRIALNMDQVQRYSPPPNPAKMTDARANEYVRQYGDESWELDALDPRTIDGLIREEIESALDTERWEAAVKQERGGRSLLVKASRNWSKVEAQLNKL